MQAWAKAAFLLCSALLGCSSGMSDGGDGGVQDLAARNPCGDVPATGLCRDSKTIATCVTGLYGGARVLTTTCSPGYSCVTNPGEAYCKLMAQCREGQSRCNGTTQVQVCQGGMWQSTACQGSNACKVYPGLGGACVPTGVSVTVQGQLGYEFLPPLADYSGYGNVTVASAANMLVVIIDGSSVLGSGITDRQGRFSVGAFRAPSAAAQLVYIPASFLSDNTPILAVAAAVDGNTINYSPTLWSFSTSGLPAPVGSVINVGMQVIRGASSGAVNIYQWASLQLLRAQATFGKVPQQTLVYLWQPGVDMFCGACFLNRSNGGTDIGSGAAPLHFDTAIVLSGSRQSPLHWSSSVISHEFGHYVMTQYSKPPGEGGPHFVDMVSSPGLAWSEGFATWSGQTGLSLAQGTPNPIYFTQQSGTAFFVDISRVYFSLGPITLPDPGGTLDQPINENVVAAVLWDLWRQQGDGPLVQAFTNSRIVGNENRGYKTVDLVDYADALLCTKAVTADQLTNTLRNKYQFPWDNMPLCP